MINFELHIKIPCKARNEQDKEELIRLFKEILQKHISEHGDDHLIGVTTPEGVQFIPLQPDEHSENVIVYEEPDLK